MIKFIIVIIIFIVAVVIIISSIILFKLPLLPSVRMALN